MLISRSAERVAVTGMPVLIRDVLITVLTAVSAQTFPQKKYK